MSDEDPGRLADQLDQQAGEMEKRSGKLSREIDDVGEDWQRKRADESVPGAPPDHSPDEPQGAHPEAEDADPETEDAGAESGEAGAGQAAGNPPQGDSPGDGSGNDEDD